MAKTMTKEQNLIAIREHLRDALEGDRKKLSSMWQRGIRGGWLFDKLNKRMELTEEKLYRNMIELCPDPPPQKPTQQLQLNF